MHNNWIHQRGIHRLFKKIDSIADKTFASLEATGRLMKSKFRFKLGEEALDESKRLSVRIIRNVHAPLFLLQSTNDNLVHVKGTEQAFRLAHKPKELFLLEGANHTISSYKHKTIVARKILGWLTENGFKGTSKK